MPPSIASRRILLCLIIFCLTIAAPLQSQKQSTCRGPNNVPAPSSSCLHADCQSEELTFAACTDNPAGSGGTNLSVRIRTDREDENASVIVTGLNSGGKFTLKPRQYSYWFEYLDDCSDGDLLVVCVEKQILEFSSIIFRVETAEKVKLYGLYFIESPDDSLNSNSPIRNWIPTLSYLLQASKPVDGEVRPENLDNLVALVSRPKSESSHFHLEIGVDLFDWPENLASVNGSSSSCTKTWCAFNMKQAADSSKLVTALKNNVVTLEFKIPKDEEENQADVSKHGLISILLTESRLWNREQMAAPSEPSGRNGATNRGVDCEETRSLKRKSKSLILVYVASASVLATALLLICFLVVYIRFRRRRYSNCRVLLIATVSPRCQRQLQSLQQNRSCFPAREQGWRQLCKRAGSLGYQLVAMDCTDPTAAQKLEAAIACASRVIILDDGTTEASTCEASDGNRQDRQMTLHSRLHRLAMMEKHRCTLLQPKPESELNAQIRLILDAETENNRTLAAGATLGIELESADRQKLLLPSVAIGLLNSKCFDVCDV